MFAVALPVMIAAPALNGLPVPGPVADPRRCFARRNLLWGGLMIFLVTGTGAAATVAFRGHGDPAAMLAGCLFLLAGAVITLAAIETASAAAFLAGGTVAGAGVGTGFFLGAYRLLTALAGPDQRAGLIAAIWIVYYLAFSVSVVAAGVAAAHFGLHQTAVGYSAALAVLGHQLPARLPGQRGVTVHGKRSLDAAGAGRVEPDHDAHFPHPRAALAHRSRAPFRPICRRCPIPITVSHPYRCKDLGVVAKTWPA